MQEVYFKVDIIESERGWGSKVEATYYFKTSSSAEKFKEKYNASNKEDFEKTTIVPDWYMQAEDPVKVDKFKVVSRLNELFKDDPKAKMFHRDALKDEFWDNRR